MKKLNLIILMFITLVGTAQDESKFFVSVGLDPVILSGTNFLADGDRVASGHLNYILQFGRELYSDRGVNYKFGFQFEQFKEINYTNYGTFGGVTFTAPKIPFTNLSIGHYWYSTLEILATDRKGIKDSDIYNASDYTSWALGLNIGVVVQKPDLYFLKLPFDVEFLFNLKDRQDLRVHYTGGKLDSLNDLKPSFYFLIKTSF